MRFYCLFNKVSKFPTFRESFGFSLPIKISVTFHSWGGCCNNDWVKCPLVVWSVALEQRSFAEQIRCGMQFLTNCFNSFCSFEDWLSTLISFCARCLCQATTSGPIKNDSAAAAVVHSSFDSPSSDLCREGLVRKY